jgi:hypothetical protein
MEFKDSCILVIPSTILMLVGISLAQSHSQTEGSRHMSMHGEHETTMESCERMKSQHEQVKATTGELDQKLSSLLKKMNLAQGDLEIEAMAAVVNTLVEQSSLVGQRLVEIVPHHMAEHLEAQGDSQHSMMACPMMQEMSGSEEAAGGHDHSAHD